ncbi:MAG: symmetrical bis(5'-nucleosyl)-tetraphosphatase [Thermoanaerobaculia bacterium]
MHSPQRREIFQAMATYAIGDVHGCFDTLKKLLERIRFDPRKDRLWMVGDLVNGGPRSLDVLRWVVENDGRIVAVLGNHDLHLLARAAGLSKPKKRDTLEEILNASDRDDLLAWLRSRPLIHRDGEAVLVHAGFFPDWSVRQAERLAREVEKILQGDEAEELLPSVDVKTPERWQDELSGLDRARVALAGFAKLRTLDSEGRMCAEFTGPPEKAPEECIPWYAFPGRQSAGATVIFGHWAALGFRIENGVAALDSGCVWGGELTALRLDDWKAFPEPAIER